MRAEKGSNVVRGPLIPDDAQLKPRNSEPGNLDFTCCDIEPAVLGMSSALLTVYL